MSLSFTLLYFIKYYNRKNVSNLCRVEFPYLLPIFLYAVSRLVTCYTTIVGFGDEFARFIGYLFSSCIEIWLIWKIVETRDDFSFLLKGLTVIFLFAGIYGIITYPTNSNIIFDYKSALIHDGIEAYNGVDMRGYRLTSIFEHPLGAGMNFGLYIILMLIAIYVIKDRINYKEFVLVAISCGIICIFFSKMRSGLLFTMIGLLAVLDLKRVQTYKILIGATLLLTIASPIYKDQFDILFSMFDSKAQEVIGGSNFEMRIEQLAASFVIMQKSLIGGFGEQSLFYLNDANTADLRALESVFFEEMVRHGLLGLLATFIMMYYALIKIPRKFHSKELFFIALSFWVTYSMTSIPFFRMHLYFLTLFYIIKKTPTYCLLSRRGQ
jgi:O-antigen ligase